LRKLGGVLSFSLPFYLSVHAFLSILGFCGSLILVVFQLVLNLKFKLCAPEVVNVLIKGEIEKSSVLCLGFYV
jgi:hypothetical protein